MVVMGGVVMGWMRRCRWGSRGGRGCRVGDDDDVVEEGEPVDATGSGATTSAIKVMTSGAGKSTLGGGIHQTMVETEDPNQFLKVVQMVLKEKGLARVLN
nr:hypothetical protein [Tanacetum cinerariifolium]